MLRFKQAILLFLLFLFACNTPSKLSEMNWLLGKWQINESNNFEAWEKVDASLYRGKGYQVRKNDTLITETINIVQKENEVFYIPSVVDQNDGKPVEFKLVSKNSGTLIFENKDHDFPQRIIYVKAGNDHINAWIEGQKEGQLSKVEFKLERIN